MRKVFLLVIVCVASLAQAQFNPEVKPKLDKVINAWFGGKTFEMDFELSANGELNFENKGKLWICGDNFKLDNDAFVVVQKENDQWVYLKEDKELTIQEVNPDEYDESNPLSILKNYGEDYNLDIISEKGDTLKIAMIPKNEESPFMQVNLSIVKSKNNLSAIQLFTKDESELRVKLNNVKEIPEENSTLFYFDESHYVITNKSDLRF